MMKNLQDYKKNLFGIRTPCHSHKILSTHWNRQESSKYNKQKVHTDVFFCKLNTRLAKVALGGIIMHFLL